MIECRYSILLAEKEVRDGRRWTQKDVLEATGIDYQALLRYAHNEVHGYSTQALVRLCNFLECEIGDLLVFVKDADRPLASVSAPEAELGSDPEGGLDPRGGG